MNPSLPYPGPERRVYNGPSDASLTRVVSLLGTLADGSVPGEPVSEEDAETLRQVASALLDEMPDYEAEDGREPYIWQDRYLAPGEHDELT